MIETMEVRTAATKSEKKNEEKKDELKIDETLPKSIPNSDAYEMMPLLR